MPKDPNKLQAYQKNQKELRSGNGYENSKTYNYENHRNTNETGENILYLSTPNKDGSFILQNASPKFKEAASIYKLIKRKDAKYDTYLVGDKSTEKNSYDMPGTYLYPLIEGNATNIEGIPNKIIKPAIINSDGTLFEKGKFDDGINTDENVVEIKEEIIENETDKKEMKNEEIKQEETVAEIPENQVIEIIKEKGAELTEEEQKKYDELLETIRVEENKRWLAKRKKDEAEKKIEAILKRLKELEKDKN